MSKWEKVYDQCLVSGQCFMLALAPRCSEPMTRKWTPAGLKVPLCDKHFAGYSRSNWAKRGIAWSPTSVKYYVSAASERARELAYDKAHPEEVAIRRWSRRYVMALAGIKRCSRLLKKQGASGQCPTKVLEAFGQVRAIGREQCPAQVPAGLQPVERLAIWGEGQYRRAFEITARALGHGLEPDWRPAELIPEDHYALGGKR